MTERRSTYFIYQGLLTVILLLFFLYQRQLVPAWPAYLALLIFFLGGSLVLLSKVPADWLTKPSLQGGLFLGDVFLSTLTLQLAQRPDSDLYLTYFLVILGTALTQNMVQSFLVASLATFLYVHVALRSTAEWSLGTEFWLRIPYLWIVAAFTAMLTRDTHEERQKREHEYKERLSVMERLALLGQLSAEIVHRIKAPLTTIRVNAEVLTFQRGISKKMKKELQQIQDEIDHCKEILQKLLDLGRIEKIDLRPIDFRDPIRAAVRTVMPQIERHNIQMELQGMDHPATISGDPELLSESIVAVLQNAVEAMPHGGKLRVGLHWMRYGPWWSILRKNRDSFEVVIDDTGAGINPSQLETIFQPFFTTKDSQGHGLGLSAALRILVQHGGSIKALSDGPGKGACFILSVPKML